MGWLLLVVFMALWTISCLRRCKPDERLLVFHHGKFSRAAGPGFSFVIFPEEEAIPVKLDEFVPTWRALPPKSIQKEFARLAELGKLPAPAHADANLTRAGKSGK